MLCERCGKNAASVHVTELEPELTQQHVCDVCAQELDLPHAAPQTKSMADVWKLLQISAQHARRKTKTRECPQCKMSLEELRARGRLGCSHCYEVFGDYLEDLFERMHGARRHVGRVPGIGEGELARAQRISDLEQELDASIREEAYERAASIRDELKALEGPDEADVLTE